MLLALIINCNLNLTNDNEDFLDNYIETKSLKIYYKILNKQS